MKFLLGIAILLLIAFSLVADYLWKKWMAARRAEREAGRETESQFHRDPRN